VVFDQLRVEIAAAVFREMSFKVVGDFGFAFHPQIRIGVARVATALFDRRAFQHGDLRTALCGRHRSGKAGDAATGDDDIKRLCRDGHCRKSPVFVLKDAIIVRYCNCILGALARTRCH
jgi:hypothetical protein